MYDFKGSEIHNYLPYLYSEEGNSMNLSIVHADHAHEY